MRNHASIVTSFFEDFLQNIYFLGFSLPHPLLLSPPYGILLYYVYKKKQAREGNSRVRLEMTYKRAKTCQNVKNVENVEKC